MHILFITEKFPYPLDSGGKIRTYHILKGLSQEHDVTLITTVDHDELRQYIPELNKICQQVIVINAPHETTYQLGVKVLKSLISPIPIVVERHYSQEVARAVQEQFHDSRSHFDVVHFDHLDASLYLRDIPSGTFRTVLDEHNIVTNQIKTSADAEQNVLKRGYMRLQQKKTYQYEINTCYAMTRNFVCSEKDKAYLLGMAQPGMLHSSHVVTIPNGVDVEYFSDTSWLDDSQEDFSQASRTMIFVGTLDYGPGGAAVRYFCEDILPLIQQNIPDVRFFAVGQNPPTYLKTLADHDSRIVVTGRVDDIRPYVARSNVFVVPLKSGSGTRLKILDAMAMRIPIVSTSIGAEGLEVRSEEHLLLADTPETFSAAVLRLLEDDNLATRIRDNARRLVQDRYSWTTIWGDLLTAYKELENMV